MLVVADASVLINFLRAGRLDLLRHHGGYRIVVTEHARREVRYPDQAAELAEAITAGDIDEIQVTDPVELETFAELSALGLPPWRPLTLAASSPTTVLSG